MVALAALADYFAWGCCYYPHVSVSCITRFRKPERFPVIRIGEVNHEKPWDKNRQKRRKTKPSL